MTSVRRKRVNCRKFQCAVVVLALLACFSVVCAFYLAQRKIFEFTLRQYANSIRTSETWCFA